MDDVSGTGITLEAASNPPVKQAKAKKGKQTGMVARPAAEGAGFCVYLGPSIRGAVSEGTVFGDGKAAVCKRLERVIGEFPLVADLLVQWGELPAARVKVSAPGNLLFDKFVRLSRLV